MKCEEIKERILQEYEEQKALNGPAGDHLRECHDCQAWNGALQKAHAMMSELDSPALPDNFAHTVALLAQEREQKSWGKLRNAITGAADRLGTLILGPETGTSGTFAKTGVIWSLLIAVATGASIFSTHYLRQSLMKWLLSNDVSIVHKTLYNQFFWLPLTHEMHWRACEHGVALAATALSLFMVMAFSRILNIRALAGALRSRNRLSPWAVVLPLLGIYLAFLLWHFTLTMMHISTELSTYPTDKANYYYATSLVNLFNGFPGFLAVLFGPLSAPFLGWALCALALLLLITRCSRGVPSLVIYFYGCTICAVFIQFLTEKVFPGMFGKVIELWSCGNIGIMSQKPLGLTTALFVALAGIAVVALSMLLRFDERSGSAIRVKVVTASVAMTSVIVLFLLFILPVGRQLQVSSQYLCGDEASSFARWQKEKKMSYTIVPLIGDCLHNPKRFFAGRKRQNVYSPDLVDEAEYSRMHDLAFGPFTIESYRAFWFIYGRALADWDDKKLDEALIIRTCAKLKNLSRFDWYRDNKYVLYCNGRSLAERKALLDMLSNANNYYLAEPARAQIGALYRLIGENEKAARMVSGITSKKTLELYHPGYSDRAECACGTIQGRLLIKGKPARNVPIRLFYNNAEIGYYYHNKRDTRFFGSEDEALYCVNATLSREQDYLVPMKRRFYSPDMLTFLPLIITRTDDQGRFRFDNLDCGGYYMALRFPGEIGTVTQKNNVGVITLTKDMKTRDLGTILVDVEGGK
jgi:hypothetical protein